MSKKTPFKVLSTATMAAAVMAGTVAPIAADAATTVEAPEAGVYFGGDTDVFMSLTDIAFNNDKFGELVAGTSLKEINVLLDSTKFGNLDALTKGGEYGEYQEGDIPAGTYNDINGDVAVEVPEVSTELAVDSVSAISGNQLKLMGSNLEKLNSEALSLDGNSVVSIEMDDEGNALATFEDKFPSEEEQTVTLTSEIDGEEISTDFNFTYTFTFDSVEVKDATIDANQDAQKLEFTLDGSSIDNSYLVDAGYDIEFQATQNNVFENNTTGKIDETSVKAGDTFEYKVVLTKGEMSYESDLKEVTVVDNSAVTTEITSYDLLTNTDVEVTSGKVALQDTGVSIGNIEGTLLDGTTDAALADAKFKSSNTSVAVINSAGDITPIAPGNVTFTVKSDEATVEVPVSIVKEARTASEAVASASGVKLVSNATKDINLTISDQYGDPIKDFDLSTLSVENSNGSVIATTDDPAATDKEGNTSFTLTADSTEVGSGVLKVKNGEEILTTVDVTVGSTGNVSERKLELVDSSADLELDIKRGSTDDSVKLEYNQYNENGLLIGAENSIEDTGDYANEQFKVVSSNTDVATVDVTSGEITINGGTKAGTATIKVMEGSVTRSSVTITVTDSTPEITSVDFEDDLEISTASKLDLDQDVIKSENITLSDEGSVAITDDGVIYIDVQNPGYDVKDDITLGYITAVSNVQNSGTDVPVAIANGDLGTTSGAAFASGDNGEIIVKVTNDGESVPVGTTTVNVDIP